MIIFSAGAPAGADDCCCNRGLISMEDSVVIIREHVGFPTHTIASLGPASRAAANMTYCRCLMAGATTPSSSCAIRCRHHRASSSLP